MQILSGKKPRPRRILLYGTPKIGKSTWASQAPSPLFLNIEDGLGDIDCDHTPKLNSYGEVVGAISWLNSNPHEFKTIVVDTLDWLEHLIQQDVAQELGKSAFSLIKFGDGNGPALKKMLFLFSGFEALQKKGIGVILLAHAKVNRIEEPGMPAYDKYEIDLHKSVAPSVIEWCDDVLFARFRVFTKTEDAGFGRERALAMGGEERFIQTRENATAKAGNRCNLPGELPMNWNAYAAGVAQFYETGRRIREPKSAAEIHVPAPADPNVIEGANIEGIVRNGSSKEPVSA